MAYSDATRVDEATARMTDVGGEQTAIRAAVKTAGDSIETVLTAYGLNAMDSQAIRDKVIDLCRYMDAVIR